MRIVSITEGEMPPFGGSTRAVRTPRVLRVIPGAAERARWLRTFDPVTDFQNSPSDVDELLNEALDGIRAAVSADTAAVLLLDPAAHFLVAAAARGVESEVRQGARVPVGKGFAGRVASGRAPVIIDEVTAESVVNPLLISAGLRTLLGVPLLAGDVLVGVLHVGRLTDRSFGPADTALLEEIASRLALALRTRTTRSEREAAVALQRSLWPEALPAVPGLEFAARYVPAGNGGTSGDWYDVLTAPSGATWVVMGDVAGRGLAAAVAMGRLRSALRAYAIEVSDPVELLDRLDRQLQHFDPGVMATVLCAVLDPLGRVMRLSTAGHPPPVVAVGDGLPPVMMDLPVDRPLGVGRLRPRRTTRLALPPGATVCFYTDGLVERRHRPISDGIAALEKSMFGGHAESVCARVMADLVGDEPVDDDVAVLVMRRLPVDESRSLVTRMPAVPASLQPLRQTVRTWLGDLGADRVPAEDLLLAIGEAVTNAVEHAYGPRPGEVVLSLVAEGDLAICTVSDTGRWRSPRGTLRGRGLTLMEALTGTLDVARGDAGTTVRMTRSLREGGR